MRFFEARKFQLRSLLNVEYAAYSGSRGRNKRLASSYTLSTTKMLSSCIEMQPLSLKMQVELRCQSTCLHHRWLHQISPSPAGKLTSANQPCSPAPFSPHCCQSKSITSLRIHTSAMPPAATMSSAQLDWTTIFSASPNDGAWLPAANPQNACMEIMRRPCHAAPLLPPGRSFSAQFLCEDRICLLTGNSHPATGPLTRVEAAFT
jgi:hypothetical protein